MAIITILAGILRFYNLNWDGPFSLHPDERNIARAVLNLDFPRGDLNPNFFAYGAFPLYLIYLAAPLDPEQIVLAGRILSALFSTLTIPLVYFSAILLLNLLNKKTLSATGLALAAALIAAFNPGMIQYAHFATFEALLTIQYLVIAFLGMKLAQTGKWRDYLLLGFFISMSIATKVVSLTMLPILFVADLFSRMKNPRPNKAVFSLVSGFLNTKFLGSLLLALLVAILLSPFNLIDFERFQQNIESESAIAKGTVVLSYTQKFLDTTPVFYQYRRVFPYILGIPLTLLGTIGIFILLAHSVRICKKSFAESIDAASGSVVVFTFVPLCYAVFHFGLFVKWTRYMVPLVPFLIIGAMVVFSKGFHVTRVTSGTMKNLSQMPRTQNFILSAVPLGISTVL